MAENIGESGPEVAEGGESVALDSGLTIGLDQTRVAPKSDVKRPTKETILLRNPRILRLDSSEMCKKYIDALVEVYFPAWSSLGLCCTRNEARELMSLIDLSETFVLDCEETGACSAIHTLPVRADSILDLCKSFTRYYTTLIRSGRDRRDPSSKEKNPNVRICFAISSSEAPGKRVRVLAEDDEDVSRFEYLIKNLPPERGVIKVAQSRMNGVGPGVDPVVHYVQNRGPKKKGSAGIGPVGMHEHIGGIAVCVAKESRPRDKKSGRSNVWVAYPPDTETGATVRDYKLQLARGKPVGFYPHGNTVLLEAHKFFNLCGK